MPGVVAKGLSTCDLPRKALFGCDDTGVQLFHATDGRSPIEGEGYPYHIIHSWSRIAKQRATKSLPQFISIVNAEISERALKFCSGGVNNLAANADKCNS